MTRLQGFARYMEWERGFRGWFVFFFLSTCLGGLVEAYLLVLSGRLLAHLQTIPAPGRLVLATWVQVILRAALFGGMVYGLWLFAHEHRLTPRYWTLFFLLAIPMTAVSDGVTAYRAAVETGGQWAVLFSQDMAGGGWRGLLVQALWALYWARAKRVRHTYGYPGLGTRSTLGASTPAMPPAA